MINDIEGREMNYMKVKPAIPSYQPDQLVLPDMHQVALMAQQSLQDIQGSVLDEDSDIRVLSTRVVGSFQGVKTLSRETLDRMFQNDWNKMDLSDIIRQAEKREAIKEVLYNYNHIVRETFRQFSSQNGRDELKMNIIKFLHLCHIINIPDKVI